MTTTLGVRPPATATPPRRAPAVKTTAKIAWKSTRWTVRMGWRHRVILAPIYATVAEYILAMVEHHLGGGGSIILAAAAVAGLALHRWHGIPTPARLSERDQHGQWTTIGIWSALGVVTVLGVVTANVGSPVPIPGIWAIVGVAITAGWWTIRGTRPEDVVAVQADRVQATWTAKVAAQRGPLPGSELGNVSKVDGKSLAPEGHLGPIVDRTGWTAIAELADGASAESVLTAANTSKIAAAYKTATINVVISRDDHQSEHRIRTTVMTRNATDDVTYYDPKIWQVESKGCVPVAVCSDGTVPQIPIWKPGSGPKHGMVSGDSGSGKSKAVGVVITQSCATGRVVPVIADPQGGASLPAWAGRKAGVAPVIARTPEEIGELFARLAQLGMHRENLISSLGVGDWDVETMWNDHREPVYQVVLDEAHIVLTDPDMVKHVANAVKVWRKLGMQVLLISQTPNLTELGGDASLRQNLLGGYVIALRNSARTAGGMILPDSAPSPYNIPKIIGKQSTEGMCSISAAAPFGAPTGFARFPFMPSDMAQSEATRLAKDVIPDPDPVGAKLLGVDIPAWRKRIAEIAEGSAEPDSAPSALVERDRATAGNRIVDYLSNAPTSATETAQIVADLGLKPQTVSTTLKRLQSKGLVVSPAHGLWSAK